MAFYEVGKKEYLANIGNIASNPENCFYRLLPAIVNLAFSIELSFKTFINEDDAKKCKHDLQKLFEKVGSPVKDVLMAAVISQMQHHDATFNEKTFGEYLDRNKEAFEDWRYYYQRGKTVDITFLYDMATVTTNFVKEAKCALVKANLYRGRLKSIVLGYDKKVPKSVDFGTFLRFLRDS